MLKNASLYWPRKYHMSLQNIFWIGPFLTYRPIRPKRSTTVHNGLTRPKNGPFMTIYSPWKSPKHRLGLKLPIHLVFVIPWTVFPTGSTFSMYRKWTFSKFLDIFWNLLEGLLRKPYKEIAEQQLQPAAWCWLNWPNSVCERHNEREDTNVYTYKHFRHLSWFFIPP